ncbi:hypothetical protein [Aquihabitans sp. McL0605]|uniref:META domain-containing protein n=1 Tax=Aquihabitans sp. McL0605 TaxID=3415671 RepID=UPI003CF78FFD
MTETPPPDDALDDRIRAGLDALVREAPAAPELPTGSPAATPVRATRPAGRRRPILIGLAAAAVLVLVVVSATHLHRSGRDERLRVGDATTTTAGPAAAVSDRPLYGTLWTLSALTEKGGPVDLSGLLRHPPTVAFDEATDCREQCDRQGHPGFELYDGCNSGGGDLRVDGDEMWGVGGVVTVVGCRGLTVAPFVPEPRGASEQGATTFAVTGDTLVLHGPDGRVLTYKASDAPFASPDGAVVFQDRISTGSYRLTWEGPDGHERLDFESVTSGGANKPTEAVDLDAERPDQVVAAKASLGDEDVVFGVVSDLAVRLSYVPSGSGLTVELARHAGAADLGAAQAFSGVVPAGVAAWDVVAYAADGSVLSRSSDLDTAAPTTTTSNATADSGAPVCTEVQRPTAGELAVPAAGGGERLAHQISWGNLFVLDPPSMADRATVPRSAVSLDRGMGASVTKLAVLTDPQHRTWTGDGRLVWATFYPEAPSPGLGGPISPNATTTTLGPAPCAMVMQTTDALTGQAYGTQAYG